MSLPHVIVCCKRSIDMFYLHVHFITEEIIKSFPILGNIQVTYSASALVHTSSVT